MSGSGSGRFKISRWRRGQAMAEYAIVAGLLISALAILTLFLSTFSQYGNRVLETVASDYP
jgi:hypothetical protein